MATVSVRRADKCRARCREVLQLLWIHSLSEYLSDDAFRSRESLSSVARQSSQQCSDHVCKRRSVARSTRGVERLCTYFDPNFIGLTGTDEQISEAAKAYGATYEKVHHPGEDQDVYFMNHSAFTYLISPDGNWKLLYDFDLLNDTEKIVADIEHVLAGG